MLRQIFSSIEEHTAALGTAKTNGKHEDSSDFILV